MHQHGVWYNGAIHKELAQSGGPVSANLQEGLHSL